MDDLPDDIVSILLPDIVGPVSSNGMSFVSASIVPVPPPLESSSSSSLVVAPMPTATVTVPPVQTQPLQLLPPPPPAAVAVASTGVAAIAIVTERASGSGTIPRLPIDAKLRELTLQITALHMELHDLQTLAPSASLAALLKSGPVRVLHVHSFVDPHSRAPTVCISLLYARILQQSTPRLGSDISVTTIQFTPGRSDHRAVSTMQLSALKWDAAMMNQSGDTITTFMSFPGAKSGASDAQDRVTYVLGVDVERPSPQREYALVQADSPVVHRFRGPRTFLNHTFADDLATRIWSGSQPSKTVPNDSEYFIHPTSVAIARQPYLNVLDSTQGVVFPLIYHGLGGSDSDIWPHQVDNAFTSIHPAFFGNPHHFAPRTQAGRFCYLQAEPPITLPGASRPTGPVDVRITFLETADSPAHHQRLTLWGGDPGDSEMLYLHDHYCARRFAVLHCRDAKAAVTTRDTLFVVCGDDRLYPSDPLAVKPDRFVRVDHHRSRGGAVAAGKLLSVAIVDEADFAEEDAQGRIRCTLGLVTEFAVETLRLEFKLPEASSRTMVSPAPMHEGEQRYETVHRAVTVVLPLFLGFLWSTPQPETRRVTAVPNAGAAAAEDARPGSVEAYLHSYGMELSHTTCDWIRRFVDPAWWDVTTATSLFTTLQQARSASIEHIEGSVGIAYDPVRRLHTHVYAVVARISALVLQSLWVLLDPATATPEAWKHAFCALLHDLIRMLPLEASLRGRTLMMVAPEDSEEFAAAYRLLFRMQFRDSLDMEWPILRDFLQHWTVAPVFELWKQAMDAPSTFRHLSRRTNTVVSGASLVRGMSALQLLLVGGTDLFPCAWELPTSIVALSGFRSMALEPTSGTFMQKIIKGMRRVSAQLLSERKTARAPPPSSEDSKSGSDEDDEEDNNGDSTMGQSRFQAYPSIGMDKVISRLPSDAVRSYLRQGDRTDWWDTVFDTHMRTVDPGLQGAAGPFGSTLRYPFLAVLEVLLHRVAHNQNTSADEVGKGSWSKWTAAWPAMLQALTTMLRHVLTAILMDPGLAESLSIPVTSHCRFMGRKLRSTSSTTPGATGGGNAGVSMIWSTVEFCTHSNVYHLSDDGTTRNADPDVYRQPERMFTLLDSDSVRHACVAYLNTDGRFVQRVSEVAGLDSVLFVSVPGMRGLWQSMEEFKYGDGSAWAFASRPEPEFYTELARLIGVRSTGFGTWTDKPDRWLREHHLTTNLLFMMQEVRSYQLAVAGTDDDMTKARTKVHDEHFARFANEAWLRASDLLLPIPIHPVHCQLVWTDSAMWALTQPFVQAPIADRKQLMAQFLQPASQSLPRARAGFAPAVMNYARVGEAAPSLLIWKQNGNTRSTRVFGSLPRVLPQSAGLHNAYGTDAATATAIKMEDVYDEKTVAVVGTQPDGIYGDRLQYDAGAMGRVVHTSLYNRPEKGRSRAQRTMLVFPVVDNSAKAESRDDLGDEAFISPAAMRGRGMATRYQGFTPEALRDEMKKLLFENEQAPAVTPMRGLFQVILTLYHAYLLEGLGSAVLAPGLRRRILFVTGQVSAQKRAERLSDMTRILGPGNGTRAWVNDMDSNFLMLVKLLNLHLRVADAVARVTHARSLTQIHNKPPNSFLAEPKSDINRPKAIAIVQQLINQMGGHTHFYRKRPWTGDVDASGAELKETEPEDIGRLQTCNTYLMFFLFQAQFLRFNEELIVSEWPAWQYERHLAKGRSAGNRAKGSKAKIAEARKAKADGDELTDEQQELLEQEAGRSDPSKVRMERRAEYTGWVKHITSAVSKSAPLPPSHAGARTVEDMLAELDADPRVASDALFEELVSDQDSKDDAGQDDEDSKDEDIDMNGGSAADNAEAKLMLDQLGDWMPLGQTKYVAREPVSERLMELVRLLAEARRDVVASESRRETWQTWNRRLAVLLARQRATLLTSVVEKMAASDSDLARLARTVHQVPNVRPVPLNPVAAVSSAKQKYVNLRADIKAQLKVLESKEKKRESNDQAGDGEEGEDEEEEEKEEEEEEEDAAVGKGDQDALEEEALKKRLGAVRAKAQRSSRRLNMSFPPQQVTNVFRESETYAFGRYWSYFPAVARRGFNICMHSLFELYQGCAQARAMFPWPALRDVEDPATGEMRRPVLATTIHLFIRNMLVWMDREVKAAAGTDLQVKVDTKDLEKDGPLNEAQLRSFILHFKYLILTLPARLVLRWFVLPRHVRKTKVVINNDSKLLPSESKDPLEQFQVITEFVDAMVQVYRDMRSANQQTVWAYVTQCNRPDADADTRLTPANFPTKTDFSMPTSRTFLAGTYRQMTRGTAANPEKYGLLLFSRIAGKDRLRQLTHLAPSPLIVGLSGSSGGRDGRAIAALQYQEYWFQSLLVINALTLGPAHGYFAPAWDLVCAYLLRMVQPTQKTNETAYAWYEDHSLRLMHALATVSVFQERWPQICRHHVKDTVTSTSLASSGNPKTQNSATTLLASLREEFNTIAGKVVVQGGAKDDDDAGQDRRLYRQIQAMCGTSGRLKSVEDLAADATFDTFQNRGYMMNCYLREMVEINKNVQWSQRETRNISNPEQLGMLSLIDAGAPAEPLEELEAIDLTSTASSSSSSSSSSSTSSSSSSSKKRKTPPDKAPAAPGRKKGVKRVTTAVTIPHSEKTERVGGIQQNRAFIESFLKNRFGSPIGSMIRWYGPLPAEDAKEQTRIRAVSHSFYKLLVAMQNVQQLPSVNGVNTSYIHFRPIHHMWQTMAAYRWLWQPTLLTVKELDQAPNDIDQFPFLPLGTTPTHFSRFVKAIFSELRAEINHRFMMMHKTPFYLTLEQQKAAKAHQANLHNSIVKPYPRRSIKGKKPK